MIALILKYLILGFKGACMIGAVGFFIWWITAFDVQIGRWRK